jgi:hypothetical protein
VEHPSLSQLDRYGSPSLTPEDRLELDDHLATCETCRERVVDPATLPSAVARLQRTLADSLAAPPLPEDQSAAPQPGGWPRSGPPVRASWIPAWAAVAACVAAVIAGAWLSLRGLPPAWWPVHRDATNVDASRPGHQRGEGPAPATQEPTRLSLIDQGGTLSVHADGRVEGLGRLPAAIEQRLRRVATGELRVPVLAPDVSIGRRGLRSGDEEQSLALLKPVSVAVESDRPAFRWSPLPGAATYTVLVYDGQGRPVTRSPALSGMGWTPPNPLPRGATYLWQVRAALKEGGTITSPAPPEGFAPFHVLDAASVQELVEARRAPPSHFRLGVVYAELGLLDEAQEELEALAKLNPQSGLVRQLLERVRLARSEHATRAPG